MTVDRSDLTISKDDLDEIFGGVIKAKNEKLKEAEPVKNEEQKKETITEQRPPLIKQENDVDELIKRAREIEREIESAPRQPPELSGPDFVNEKILIQIFEIFEEIRKILYSEITAYIDAKAVKNMLLRTLEKTALNYMILKNTNRDTGGNFRDNGSINTGKALKNINSFSDRINKTGREIEEALATVLYMRLKSVKLGLGPEKYSAIKEALKKRMFVIEGGYKGEVIGFIREKIITPAVKRGDNEN